MVDDDREQEPFAVKDKRRFSEDKPEISSGDEQPARDQDRPEAPPKAAGASQVKNETPPAADERNVPLPQIDFSTFILSLSSNALLHLGLMENPLTKKVERNLPVAKQTIDIISMLKDKAKGNLTNEEANLVENLLSDLRLKYVQEVNKG